MIELVKGQNISIDEYPKINISIEWQSDNNIEIDVSLFMLHEGKLESINDFIYYNNTQNDSIALSTASNSANILINAKSIPREINKIPIVLTINDASSFASLKYLTMNLNDKIIYHLDGVKNEKSIIISELYFKENKLKYKIVAQGFNDGLEVLANHFGLNLDSLSAEEKNKKFRKSTKDIIDESIAQIKTSIELLKPSINAAINNRYNESDTRMILDKIFIEVLGYAIDDIKTEQKIQGRRADYILSLNGEDYIVVEAKKAGMNLKEKQVFQATSYGAYSGIKWALLTNLLEWQLYYINSGDKIEPELVFEFDLKTIKNENLERLFAISKNGIIRKGILERTRARNRALSQANIITTLLTDNVLNKIRTTINKDSSYKVSNQEIQEVLENFLNI